MGRDKRMDAFAREIFRLGTLRGFQHFDVQMRGREELLVMLIVDGTPQTPGEREPVPVSTIPPASPSERERKWDKDELPECGQRLTFLVGGYAHYNCPFVWVRTGHELLGPAYAHADCRDVPLRLKSTQDWKHRSVAAWEIVAELVMQYSSTK